MKNKANILREYDSKRDLRRQIIEDLAIYKTGVEECVRHAAKAQRELEEAQERLTRIMEYEERNRKEIDELWNQLVNEEGVHI
jgi:hypothetical protein